VTPVQKLELQSEDYMEQVVEEKTLFDLKQIVNYTYLKQKNLVHNHTDFFSRKRTMVLQSLQSYSRIILGDDGYDCTKDGCSFKQYDWK